MKTGIFITVRLGSSRLAQKHLLPALGEPILAVLVNRIRHEFALELQSRATDLVIVTSDEPENRTFEPLAHKLQASVFYGSIRNIPLRHVQAAQARGVDAILAVDGDDILCSTAAMRSVFERLGSGAAYVKTAGLPLGMNAFGYSRAMLEKSANRDGVCETDWTRVFDTSALETIAMPALTEVPLRFTLDYGADYRFFKAVIERMGEKVVGSDDAEIVRTGEAFAHMNQSVSDQYWQNLKAAAASER